MMHSPLYTLVILATISILPDVVPQDAMQQERDRLLWRRLLQDPASSTPSPTTTTSSGTYLNLCETNLCESQRADGVCDRWAKSSACGRRDIFYVEGDPGDNDKAEMFFNLRSPYGISCSMGRCSPAEGAVYDVFVAEGCIPEQDYVSEMQDVSSRTSKQVKIYLRRKAKYYISISRKDNYIAASDNCTYGITTGSIESIKPSRCFNFMRLSETDIVSQKVPDCRDVMPVFNQQAAAAASSSTPATFVVALIGVGVLSIALLVVAFIMVRRFRRRSKLGEKPGERLSSIKFEGVGVAGGDVESAEVEQDMGGSSATRRTSQDKHGKGSGSKPEGPGSSAKKQRERLATRLTGLDKDDSEGDDDVRRSLQHTGEVGTGAGILDDDNQPGRRRVSSSEQIQKGVSGGRLVFGGKGSQEASSGSGSSGRSDATPSPAEELQRSMALPSRNIPGGKKPRDGSERGSSAGSLRSTRSVRDTDLEVIWKVSGRAGESGAARPGTGSSQGSAIGAGWGDETGIRIDDILEEAKRAKPGAPKVDVSTPRRSPERSPSAAGSDTSHLSATSPISPQRPTLGAPPQGISPPRPPSSLQPGPPAGARPALAPLMAARLGLPSPGATPSPGPGTLGSGMRVPPPAQSASARRSVPITFTTSPPRADLGWPSEGSPGPEKDSLAPATGKAVALAGISKRDLPRSSQSGVPPPPPRPSQNNGVMRPFVAPSSAVLGSIVGSVPANTGSLDPAASLSNQPFNAAGVQSNINAFGRASNPVILGARPSGGGAAPTSGDGRSMSALGAGAAGGRPVSSLQLAGPAGSRPPSMLQLGAAAGSRPPSVMQFAQRPTSTQPPFGGPPGGAPNMLASLHIQRPTGTQSTDPLGPAGGSRGPQLGMSAQRPADPNAVRSPSTILSIGGSPGPSLHGLRPFPSATSPQRPADPYAVPAHLVRPPAASPP